ncbi:hypothetical protein EJB05_05684, partial [Eragrostis curvula]
MAATTDIRLSVAHQTGFALRLAAALFSQPRHTSHSTTNAAFSPLSIHATLSLLAAGAGGATRDQLAEALGEGDEGLHALAEHLVQFVLTDGSGTGSPQVTFANGVFVDASLKLKPACEEVAVSKYKAETHSVDFQKKAAEAASQINAWVEKITTGLIKELLSPGSVDQTTRLIIGNALYFKGVWTEKFDASKTKDCQFHLLDGSSVQAPFMSSTRAQYVASYDNLKVLKLPYQQGGDKRQFSLYILLPEAKDGLWSLAEKLSSEPEFLEKHIPVRKVVVGQFNVPKFKISFGFDASNLLKGLGLHLLFSAEADFSQLVDSPAEKSLCVSSIVHKCFVEVDEEGTEAAAACAIITKRCYRNWMTE